MNDPYVLSIVAKGYRLRFTSPPLQTPWDIRSPQDPEEILGMREQITLMLQKNAITEGPPNSPGFYSNVFLVRKASGGWRPVIDLKNLNAHIHAPHFRMFMTNSVLSSVRKGDYAFKIDLQDAYYSSQQQKVPQVRLRKQGVPVSSATIRSEYSPSGFYLIGAHGDRLSAPSGDLSDTISRRLVNSPSGPQSFTPTSSSANKYARPFRLCTKQKSELDLTRDLQFLGIRLRLDLGEASLPESKAWEIAARARHLSSLHVLSYTQVSQLMGSLNWASGLIPLGRLYLRPLQRHFHSLGLTDRFTPPRRSDPLVLANLLRQWQDPHFLTSGIPICTFQAEFTIFTDASMQGWGAHMRDSQISRTWTHTDRKLHINCLELKAVIHALQHWAPVLQGHQVMIATDNSTVVSYINKQGGTHSPTLLHLTVELLLWLEAQNIIVRARHIPGCLNMIADHLSCPNQPISPEWSLHPRS